jgi:hypothetical protein
MATPLNSPAMAEAPIENRDLLSPTLTRPSKMAFTEFPTLVPVTVARVSAMNRLKKSMAKSIMVEYDRRDEALPLLAADGDDVEVLEAVDGTEVLADIEATAVSDPPEEVVLVPLDSVTLPTSSCWKAKEVPFADTCSVWMTVELLSAIENAEVNPMALAHFTPFVHSHDSVLLCVHVRLLWLKNELQFGPVQVNVTEKLRSASQNIYVPFVVVILAVE